ncbi:hypothetical protein [Armatimonas sp.]|uniref:hypothetical protein n=1 Tax=Armatimonas sp. TaxID=1872638 RepID=UPI00375387F1
MTQDEISQIKDIKKKLSFTATYQYSLDSTAMKSLTTRVSSEALFDNLELQSEFANVKKPSGQFYISVYDGKNTNLLSGAQFDPIKPEIIYGNMQTRTTVETGYQIHDSISMFFKRDGEWFGDLIANGKMRFVKYDVLNNKRVLIFEMRSKYLISLLYLSKSDSYSCIKSYTTQIPNSNAVDEYNVTEFQNIEGVSLPKTATMSIYIRNGSAKKRIADGIFSNIKYYNVGNVTHDVFKMKFRTGSQMYDEAKKSVLVKTKDGNWLEDISFSDDRKKRSGIIGWFFIGSLSTLLFIGSGWLIHLIIKKRRR